LEEYLCRYVETLPQYEENLCRYDNKTTAVWKDTCIEMLQMIAEEIGCLKWKNTE
jgi:hypothetical protein